ncbi:30S ribosomal protein S6 [Thalassoroseus pseudoceratinae]|uniref:30S ribosomal protein S6 n=1 Tax=Thalassoroseus pseudoceratinae TaxID=2713176 RepID=UPI001F1171C5|nr:30S ribosomal protein S6 [Thalassoroseus pseudoceratinae]
MAENTATATAPSVNYEGMFLIDSSKYAADPEGVVKTVLEMIEKAGGEVVAHRAWQEGRLAYEIEGQRKGLHYLILFRMPGEGMKSLTRACKLSDVILRQLVIKHSEILFEAMVNSVAPGAMPDAVSEDDESSDDDSNDDDDDDDFDDDDE